MPAPFYPGFRGRDMGEQAGTRKRKTRGEGRGRERGRSGSGEGPGRPRSEARNGSQANPLRNHRQPPGTSLRLVVPAGLGRAGLRGDGSRASEEGILGPGVGQKLNGPLEGTVVGKAALELDPLAPPLQGDL